MKKYGLLFLLFSWWMCGTAWAASEMPDISARSAILIHADSGQVLVEKNADESMLIASTTKIMTALVALENLDPNREVVIDPAWTKVEGSSMYLRSGDVYTVADLLYGLMLASGNDAAMALACTVADSEEEFAQLMNAKARELGMNNSHFVNPHGLDHTDHYSTARDMAILMSAALENEIFSEITGSRSYSTHGATYINHNKLLWRYNGITGGKTGYTKAAGRCLVTACERDGLSLVCVTLSAGDDWRDHSKIYDWGYRMYQSCHYPADAPLACIPVVSGTAAQVNAVPEKDVSLCVKKDSVVGLRLYLPRFVFAKVSQGGVAGQFSVLIDGQEIGCWPLVWRESVSLWSETFFERIYRYRHGVITIYSF